MQFGSFLRYAYPVHVGRVSRGERTQPCSPKKRRAYLLEWIRRKSPWTYMFGSKDRYADAWHEVKIFGHSHRFVT